MGRRSQAMGWFNGKVTVTLIDDATGAQSTTSA
jgi:hypothetical protein